MKMQQHLTYSPIHKYFGVLEIESRQFEQERNPSVWLRKISFPAFSWTLLSLLLMSTSHRPLSSKSSLVTVTDNYEVHLLSSY